ncbi:uncharacterized protein LOC116181935 [Photinus pyralis]|uniref:uncharacterized protein LOC116181935 n=2 Tax=Photinus pyralis TaxID=7054 RepID=UPI0012674ECF|nr:uncharacterized protein LOC116181935 [Photinus pyralis]
MSVHEESESGDEVMCTPPEVAAMAESIMPELLPEKSRNRYEKERERFFNWCKMKQVKRYTETVLLAYFVEKSGKLKSSTLWSMYSMLKSMLILQDNVDISKYAKLQSFLKRKSVGHKPKKSLTFTRQQISTFLEEAPDETFLMMKVALILGVAGACRREELTKMTVNDIQGEDTFLLVTIPDSKTHVPRTFSVTEGKENWIHLYQKYKALRPQNAQTSRLFLNYKMGKCTVQPVGINTFGAIPKKIASYLKLPNASSFTSHCFRRTSATLLANAGADLLSLKRHGGWRSSTVAEGYVDGSLQGKLEHKHVGAIPSNSWYPLVQHVKRSAYQAGYIWGRAAELTPESPPTPAT